VPYASRIVLHSLTGAPEDIDALVEAFLKDGVKFVGVVGKNATHIEDLVDEVVLGDGTDDSRFLLTASHEGESLRDAVEFAQNLSDEYGKGVQVVEV
jgi:NADPH-dependent glutamate synthase beta subunit-like oxidoreductase